MEIFQEMAQEGITTIFVTHDQEEALFFGDLIAVMRSGSIEQVGRPEEVFLRPRTRFVAAFMGQTDFIPGRVKDNGIETPLGRLDLAISLPLGTQLEVALRPNHVALTTDGSPNSRILSRQFQGIAEADIGQGGQVQFPLVTHLPGQGHNTHILDNQRIGFDLPDQLGKQESGLIQFIRPDGCIESHINPHPFFMCKPGQGPQFGEPKVFSLHPGGKLLHTAINSICPCCQCCQKGSLAAGRREDLGYGLCIHTRYSMSLTGDVQ